MASTINAKNTSTGVVITPDASGQLELQTADTTRMTIDVNGNVGIGTSSPASFSGYTSLAINNATNGGFLDLMKAGTVRLRSQCDDDTGPLIYATSTYALRLGANGAERMRIDSSGNLQLSTANTSILNSSGRKILNQTGGTLQVLQAVKTDVFSVASSTFTDVTGMSVSITPSSTSSKILILVDAQIAQSGSDATMIKLVRNTTDIFIGDAAGSRIRTSTAKSFTANGIESGSIIFLDSPATTSSTTYKIQMRALTGTAYLNRSGADTDNGAHPRTASSITVMEIAG